MLMTWSKGLRKRQDCKHMDIKTLKAADLLGFIPNIDLQRRPFAFILDIETGEHQKKALHRKLDGLGPVFLCVVTCQII